MVRATGNVPPEMGHFECPKLRATTTALVVDNVKGVYGATMLSLGRK